MHETPMNAVCIKRGPTTGFRDFNIRFAYYITFPESPKADGRIRALQNLKNKTGRGFWMDRVSIRSTYDRGCDNSAICVSRGRHFECWSFGAKKRIAGKFRW
jgi:hypothetical protein